MFYICWINTVDLYLKFKNMHFTVVDIDQNGFLLIYNIHVDSIYMIG